VAGEYWPSTRNGISTLSSTVFQGSKVGCWKNDADVAPRLVDDVARPAPRLPALGGRRPERNLQQQVDFPQPEGPRMAMNSPSVTSRSSGPRAGSAPRLVVVGERQAAEREIGQGSAPRLV